MDLERLLKTISSYFTKSSLRLAKYKSLFDGMSEKNFKKLPKPSYTRWLAWEECINIILE
jgi:hypothetical protein